MKKLKLSNEKIYKLRKKGIDIPYSFSNEKCIVLFIKENKKGGVKLMGKNIEELNFLKEELKKVNEQIKGLEYTAGVLEYQAKLWALKETIEKKIADCEFNISKGNME